MTATEIWNEKIGAQVVKALEANRFEAYYCATRQEAKQKILSLIPKSETVSWGGCQTMEELGVIEEIKNGGYSVIDRDTAKSQEERTELMRKALLCGTFLSGTNAITQDGQLLNIDGNGNRVAAITYGPKNVIIACGTNKIVRNIDDALVRARTVAAPVNAQRFDIKTPCKITGKCADCNSADCICNVFVTTRHSKPAGRIKVVIVGEALGF